MTGAMEGVAERKEEGVKEAVEAVEVQAKGEEMGMEMEVSAPKEKGEMAMGEAIVEQCILRHLQNCHHCFHCFRSQCCRG